jgi:hypothetical protein
MDVSEYIAVLPGLRGRSVPGDDEVDRISELLKAVSALEDPPRLEHGWRIVR